MYPFPILTGAGLGALLICSLFPLLGFWFDLSLGAEIAIAALGLALFVFRILWEWRRAANWLKTADLSLSMPRLLRSGVPAEGQFRLTAAKAPPLISLRFAPTPHVIFAEEVISLLQEPEEQTRWHAPIQLLPIERGRIQIESVFLRVFFPRSFSGWQSVIGLSNSLEREIVANSFDDQSLSPFQPLNSGESPRERGLAGSCEFHSLRPYSRGDDRRRVDWKRSSRGRGMLVKTYRPDTHQRLSLVLDCGRRMNIKVGERLQMEYATDAVAQLIALSDTQDDEAGLFAFNHQVVASLPCARHHRGELMRAVQRLQPGQLETDFMLFSEWLRTHRRRSLLLFVTSISSPGSLDVLTKLLLPIRKSHLPVVVAIADEQLENFALSPVENLPEAYIVSAASSQLAEVKKRAASLTAKGVETLTCKAEHLSSTLRSKYLELKQSGRL